MWECFRRRDSYDSSRRGVVGSSDVLGTGFGNGTSSLKQCFVLPKNGSKYYLKYTFLAFPVLGILGLGTSLVGSRII